MSTLIQDFQKALKEKGVTENTRQAYVSDIRVFLKFNILNDIDADTVGPLAVKWLDSQGNLATNTIKRREGAIKLFAKEVLGVELVSTAEHKPPAPVEDDDIWSRIGLPYLKVRARDNWTKQAHCDDTDLMFDGRRKEEAKAVCAGCPVTEQCLQYALNNEIAHGVWGGKDEGERKALMGKYVRVRRNDC